MRYIIILILGIIGCQAAAHSSCEVELLKVNPVRRALAMVESALSTGTTKPHVRPLEIYEAVTGLKGEAIAQGLLGQIHFVRALQPIQGWRELIRLVEWHGHHYSEVKSWSKTAVYNSFWGRPINIHERDVFALSLHHQAGTDLTWVNLLLGPIEFGLLNNEDLRQALKEIDENLRSDILLYESEKEIREAYLLLSGFRNRPDSYLFIQKLISRLQDRYFE